MRLNNLTDLADLLRSLNNDEPKDGMGFIGTRGGDTMKVYIVWFGHVAAHADLIGIFQTGESAKAYIKKYSTYGKEHLYIEEHEVDQ
jgi:hypothetical protein